MLQIPTEAEIFERMKQTFLEVAGPMDVSEGSVPYDFLKTKALDQAEAYRYVEALYYAIWVENAEGDNLDLAVSVSGLIRKPSAKAKHPSPGLKLTGQPKTIVPSGTRFMTEGIAPLFFVTTEQVVMDVNGVAWASLEAESAGLDGEIPSGTVLIPVRTVNGLQKVELTAGLIGGADLESDDELRERCLQKRRRTATSGNASHYQEWALEVAGVESARVFENLDGPNTVRIVLLGQDGQVPDALVVQQARDHILAQRPLGPGDDGIFVYAATPKYIDITARLKLFKGFPPEGIKAQFELAVADYFRQLIEQDVESEVGAEIVWTKVGALLQFVQGVDRYQDLTINGAGDDIIIATDEIPVLRNCTFEVVV